MELTKVEFHKKRLAEVRETLTSKEEQFLCDLYQARMMTQGYVKAVYLSSEATLDQRLVERGLIKWDSVEDVKQANQTVCFLTSDGVGVVRQILDLPDNITRGDNIIVHRHYYKACDLEPHPIRKPADRTRLYELTRFMEVLKMKLDQDPRLTYHYYDRKFVELNLKHEKISNICPFVADGLLRLMDMDIHIHELQARPQKITYLIKNRYLPYFESEEATYLERQQFALFLLETEEEVRQCKKQVLPLIEKSLGSLFDVLIATPKQAIYYFKQRLFPVLKNPKFLGCELTKQGVGKYLRLSKINANVNQQLEGEYELMVQYQNKKALVIDARIPTLLNEKTINAHLNNQSKINQLLPLLLLTNNTELLEKRTQELTQKGAVAMPLHQFTSHTHLNRVFS